MSAIPDRAWREVALSDEEYRLLCRGLGREPTPVELGMFGAMWSEHCGYKHSLPLLRQLPTEAPWVLQGPGENAGAVDIGDGLAVVFKVESHNHPSAVEPYQGAATGVGGIVRDIFTMGARPIAILDALRFGPLDQPRNRYLFTNVVAGIGGYGNCLGIPTVGGEVFFDASFNGNPLVNAMCVGVAKHESLMRARASGLGNVIMLIGADTGRDGLHGATFASVDDPEASHRGVVQVGNPFLEKLLMEACLELLAGDDVVAMQDLGAAGLTSSVVECASRGGVGAEIDVDRVARRERGMTAYEVMLSESQERMLLVVAPDGVGRVRDVVERWSLHATEIGRVTDDGLVRVVDQSQVVAEVPARLLTEGCPTYVRDAAEPAASRQARRRTLTGLPDLPPEAIGPVLLRLLASPNVGSRQPVFDQYDHTILTNTVVPPGVADAAVLRLKGTNRGLALTIDCNSRLCWLDPKQGAMLAVAEAARNLSCVGATPLAVTNCLNFGNPERPGGSYQLREAVAGLVDACRGFELPVVSGNVSLYNETAEAPVMPTPTIGMVGVLLDISQHATMAWAEGDDILLIFGAAAELGGSEYLVTLHGLVAGAPPALDLAVERRVQAAVRQAIERGTIVTAHDCSLGGLVVALAEMAIVSGVGAVVANSPPAGRGGRLDEAWFGEATARIIVACPPRQTEAVRGIAQAAEVGLTWLGRAEGNRFLVGEHGDLSLDELKGVYDGALRFSS